MTTFDIFSSLTLRLNKGATQKYDNLWISVIEEAWHKAQTDVVRRLIRGKNQTQEGDEESKDRVDDLQVLLKPFKISSLKRKVFNESVIPKDYLYFKRVTPLVDMGVCSNLRLKSTLEEEANVDVLLHANVPSLKFEETFHTLIGNKIRVYHNDKFNIQEINIIYYRNPKVYKFSRLEEDAKTIEFKEDVCQLILDEAAKIIASDIESLNQKSLAQERAENNN